MRTNSIVGSIVERQTDAEGRKYRIQLQEEKGCQKQALSGF